jgi:ATP-binding cassette, subfamily C (CFTR/MRP), member 4
LDPFNRFTETEYWNVLETCQLKDFVSAMPGKLDAQVEEGGRNFSVGQRQLICMARSMLCKFPILLLDEATASVDANTDALIQRMIRAAFPRSTVLVIAHRLNTIMDMERILVMDDGKAVEFDTPQALLQNPKSLFSQMVEASGPASARHLRSLAGVATDLIQI